MNKLARPLMLLLLVMTIFPVAAQTPSSERDRGDYISVKLAVLGPGDALYLRWGHIGIIVEDTLSGKSRFYDYGLFSFETENFFLNFAFGRLFYAVGASPVEWNLARAVKDEREVTIMPLNLPGETKKELWAFLENNVRPENRNYLYHHYRDNCATKIRDILDRFTDGQVREYTKGPGRMTLRDHTRRHTAELPFFDWLLPFLMGPIIDTPITVWDELFLPSEFIRVFKDFTYTDGDGREIPLVSGTEIYNHASSRPPVPENPAPIWPWTLFIGLILAAVAGAGQRLHPHPGGRLLLGSLNLGMGLFFGLAGSLLCFMSLFTNHDVTYNNLNLVFINPLLLAVIPLGIGAYGKPSNRRKRPPLFTLRLIWTVMATAALGTALVTLLPFSVQKNGATLLLFLPPALAMSRYPRWIASLWNGVHSRQTTSSS